MSIGFAGLHLLLPTLKSLSRQPKAQILILGTMDLLFTYDELASFFKRHHPDFVELEIGQIRKTDSFAFVSHNDWWKYFDFLHQQTLFRMLGFDVSQIHTLDVDDYEKADIIHDLNFPIGGSMQQFDLVLDLGTLEHVFDVRQSLWNLSDLCRTGGQVIHMSPVNFLRHGFYNFTTELFGEFYKQAGWVKEDLYYVMFPILKDTTDLYGRLEPDELSTVPEGFYINVFSRHRKQRGARKPIAGQQLYSDLHQAWKTQSRADSTHVAPGQAVSTWTSRVQSVKATLDRVQAKRRLAKLRVKAIDLR